MEFDLFGVGCDSGLEILLMYNLRIRLAPEVVFGRPLRLIDYSRTVLYMQFLTTAQLQNKKCFDTIFA